MRGFEPAGALLAKADRILQSMDLPDVFRVRKIDKVTDHGNGIARADHFPSQSVSAGAVIGNAGVLILIDDLHRHEALTRLRQRNRHWAIRTTNRYKGVKFASVADHKKVADAIMAGRARWRFLRVLYVISSSRPESRWPSHTPLGDAHVNRE